MHSAHWSEEDLIELALDERSRGAEFGLCPVCTLRLHEWRDSLEEVRLRVREGREANPHSVRALAERVLAETTRYDPTRLGDRRFLDRLQRARGPSPRQKIVAAVGLLGSLAVIGTFTSRFEHGPDSGGRNAPEASLAHSHGEPDGPPTRVDGDASETVVGWILGSRSEWLQQRTAIEPSAIAGASSDPTARALLCEHVLDRYATEKYLPANFDHGIQAMLSASTSNAAARRLELAALARARDYGLLDPAEEGHLEEVLAQAGVDSSIDPLFQGGARNRAPIDSEWLGALDDALGSAERCDPVVQAWLAMR